MIRTIIASLAIFGSALGISSTYVGFDKAGKYYLQERAKENKSLRAGSIARGTDIIGGGIHSGK